MKVKPLFCPVVVMKRASNLSLFGKGAHAPIPLNMDLYKSWLKLTFNSNLGWMQTDNKSFKEIQDLWPCLHELEDRDKQRIKWKNIIVLDLHVTLFFQNRPDKYGSVKSELGVTNFHPKIKQSI